jgi:outer membrane protein OmpA-like peptidoglycan-associated protein
MLRLISGVFLLGIAAAAQGAQSDIKGSSDHPLFPSRMPGYSIDSYEQVEFASYSFRTQPPQAIEGRYTRIRYVPSDANPGELAIRRNYENAIKAAGGEVLHSEGLVSVMRGTRDGVEIWAEVKANKNGIYWLNVVEKEAMQQVITADAMAAALDKDGFIALDVHFDTGKSEILAESQPIITEIVALLQKRPDLRVGIEGHTDNTGTPETNQVLSEARAQAVAAAVAEGGIAKTRLAPAGFGQARPVADNRTADGRAQNRRVEVVKK